MFDRRKRVAKAFSAPPACMMYASGARVMPRRRAIRSTASCSSGNWSGPSRIALPRMCPTRTSWSTANMIPNIAA